MIPSSSPLSPSSGFPFSSSPLSSSAGPTLSSSTSSVFGQMVAPPFGCSSGNYNADSFNGFQLPTSGTSLSSSTPAFGPSPFEFAVPSGAVSASFSGRSSTSSAMQSSVPTFGFPQSSQVITANAGVASVVGGFSQPDVKYLCGGSLKASYSRTWDPLQGDSNSALVSISAMAVYSDKSHEELRLEDYHLRNEGNLFTTTVQSLSSASRCDATSFPSVSSSTTSVYGVSSCGTFSIPPVPSSTGDFGQFHGQCRGTQIAPYAPTFDSPGPPVVLMSISAMFVYSNKSHEELRMEDYQQRNMRASRQDKPDSRCTACRCFQSAAVSQTNQTFNPPANQFGPSKNGSGFTSNTFPGPSQGPTTGLIVHPFGLGTAYRASPLTGFVNITVPNIGAVGSPNGVFGAQQLIPMSWTPVFGFPALFTNALATSEILRGASVGLGGQNEKETQSTRSEGVPDSDNEANDKETVVNSLADVQIKGKEKEADSCVPEGLHIIIENLGFNPWAEGQIGQGSKLDFARCILPCEEAEKDEDIFALAQFAVDQHNAITEDGKVEMVGVIGASLEPVNGGRYHIVLEARDATKANGEAKRYYASVVRKMNHHQAVLEKWLPGKV